MRNKLMHFGVLGMKWGIRRYRNADGTLNRAGKKKDYKESSKVMNKRNADLFVSSNNYAANRINGEWLDGFNEKWRKEWKGYKDWTESPAYPKYMKAYNKNFDSLMNQAVKNNPDSKFTTKLGIAYTARYLEKYGNITWATNKEWEDYDKQQ